MPTQKRIKGITIEIGGETTKLTDSLKKVDSSLRTTQSSLSDVNRLLKIDPTNQELLTQKYELLNVAIKDTKERQQQLTEALNQTEKGSEQYNALQREIADTNNSMKKLQDQYDSFGNEGSKSIEKVTKKTEDLNKKLTSAGTKMSVAVTLPIVAAGTASFNAASDYEENLNKVEVAFGSASDAVTKFSEDTTKSYGISKNNALEMASLFGDMGTSMGLTQEQAADMSISLVGLAGDLASFKNIGIDQAMTALKSIFTGETESLKNLGVVMTQTNLKQFAEDCGLVYDEMSQMELVNLRYNYVLQQTANAQGDYARTSDGAANSLRTMQESADNLAVSFGEKLVPMITPIIQKITEIIDWLGSLDEGTQQMIINTLMVIAVIGPLLTFIGQVGIGLQSVGSLITWFSGTALPGITSAISAASAGAVVSLSTILPVLAAIAAAVIGIIALIDALNQKKINDEWKNYTNETTKGMTNITEEQAKNWMNSDEVQAIKNPSGTTSYYVKNSDYSWSKANAATNGWNDSSVWGDNAKTVNNMTINVDNVSSLDDLLTISEQAQQYNRME